MRLESKVCVVTGASSGIGRAIALAFAREGAHVWAIGRDRERLDSLADDAEGHAGRMVSVSADLAHEEGLESACEEILSQGDRVDVLVHGAGVFLRGQVESASAEDLDSLYRVNLRAPFVLTRTLLPALKRSRGQIVFINSSAGSTPSPGASLYAATKHGLKAFADGLRQEINSDGVRVLTVVAGRTATPMQESIHEHEGRPYRPEFLMQPEAVGEVVLAALSLSPTAEVTDVNMRPMSKLPER